MKLLSFSSFFFSIKIFKLRDLKNLRLMLPFHDTLVLYSFTVFFFFLEVAGHFFKMRSHDTYLDFIVERIASRVDGTSDTFKPTKY